MVFSASKYLFFQVSLSVLKPCEAECLAFSQQLVKKVLTYVEAKTPTVLACFFSLSYSYVRKKMKILFGSNVWGSDLSDSNKTNGSIQKV